MSWQNHQGKGKIRRLKPLKGKNKEKRWTTQASKKKERKENHRWRRKTPSFAQLVSGVGMLAMIPRCVT